MKIFYSWQSDTDQKANRNFIQDQLKRAIQTLKNDGVDYQLDMAIRDEKGTPDIVESIFRKISEASIFLCDVSIINSPYKVARKTPNPNV